MSGGVQQSCSIREKGHNLLQKQTQRYHTTSYHMLVVTTHVTATNETRTRLGDFMTSQ